jgi:hypothetical protein
LLPLHWNEFHAQCGALRPRGNVQTEARLLWWINQRVCGFAEIAAKETELCETRCHVAWRQDRSYRIAKNGRSIGVHEAIAISIAVLIPQSLQLQTQVTLASLGWCCQSGQCAKSCARRSVCFCSQSGGGAGIEFHRFTTTEW